MSIEKYIPEILKDVREFACMVASEDHEIVAARSAVTNVFNDQFASTLTTNGCKRWESILKIKPMDTDSVDIRRFRILARLNEQLPYTFRNLEHRIEYLCGENGYRIKLDKQNYVLIVKIALNVKKKYDEVVSILERTTPCNLILDVSLLYNTHSKLKTFTYNNLNNYKQIEIREEVLN